MTTTPEPPASGEDVAGHVWDRGPSEHPRFLYGERARLVYWNKDFPACRVRGPQNAECLLDPGHEGNHYGNGHDKWGPKGAFPWPNRAAAH